VITKVTTVVAALALGVIGLSVNALPESEHVAVVPAAPAVKAKAVRVAARAPSCVFTSSQVQRVVPAPARSAPAPAAKQARPAAARWSPVPKGRPLRTLRPASCLFTRHRVERIRSETVVAKPVVPVAEANLFGI